VPLAWFCTTSADYRPRKSQAYCSLLPILGFVAFLCVPPCYRTNPVAAHDAIPATLFVPLEESPRR